MKINNRNKNKTDKNKFNKNEMNVNKKRYPKLSPIIDTIKKKLSYYLISFIMLINLSAFGYGCSNPVQPLPPPNKTKLTIKIKPKIPTIPLEWEGIIDFIDIKTTTSEQDVTKYNKTTFLIKEKSFYDRDGMDLKKPLRYIPFMGDFTEEDTVDIENIRYTGKLYVGFSDSLVPTVVVQNDDTTYSDTIKIFSHTLMTTIPFEYDSTILRISPDVWLKIFIDSTTVHQDDTIAINMPAISLYEDGDRKWTYEYLPPFKEVSQILRLPINAEYQLFSYKIIQFSDDSMINEYILELYKTDLIIPDDIEIE